MNYIRGCGIIYLYVWCICICVYGSVRLYPSSLVWYGCLDVVVLGSLKRIEIFDFFCLSLSSFSKRLKIIIGADDVFVFARDKKKRISTTTSKRRRNRGELYTVHILTGLIPTWRIWLVVIALFFPCEKEILQINHNPNYNKTNPPNRGYYYELLCSILWITSSRKLDFLLSFIWSSDHLIRWWSMDNI